MFSVDNMVCLLVILFNMKKYHIFCIYVIQFSLRFNFFVIKFYNFLESIVVFQTTVLFEGVSKYIGNKIYPRNVFLVSIYYFGKIPSLLNRQRYRAVVFISKNSHESFRLCRVSCEIALTRKQVKA